MFNQFTNRLKMIYHRVIPCRAARYKKYQKYLKNKNGIEIGGPSPIFNQTGRLPIYPVISNLDGCNFSRKTIWEGQIEEGKDNFNYYRKKVGYQYICEAIDLSRIKSEKYDFVISSNTLEHIANPLQAMKEWLRILKPKGYLLLILPNKKFTFDHRRPTTKFTHLLIDFQNNVDERDLTHLKEIMRLHDLDLDPDAGDKKAFKKRSLNNYLNRCLHHHIFDQKLMRKIYNYFALKILDKQLIKGDIIILGRKK